MLLFPIVSWRMIWLLFRICNLLRFFNLIFNVMRIVILSTFVVRNRFTSISRGVNGVNPKLSSFGFKCSCSCNCISLGANNILSLATGFSLIFVFVNLIRFEVFLFFGFDVLISLFVVDSTLRRDEPRNKFPILQCVYFLLKE